MGIDVWPFDPAPVAEGIFQHQLPVIFVAALHRQAQADMLAMGVPYLLALKAPAQRIAIDHQFAAQLSLFTFGHAPSYHRRKGPKPQIRAILAAAVAADDIAVQAWTPSASANSSAA